MRAFRSLVFVLFSLLSTLICHASDRAEWEIVLSKSLQRDASSALIMLRDRYAALPYGAEKLYISSLIFSFMAERGQDYFSQQAYSDSPYQNLEMEFIDSLIAEHNQEFSEAENGFLNLYQYMKTENDDDGIFLLEYHLCKLFNLQGQYFKSRYYCEHLSQRIVQSNNALIPNYRTLKVIAKNQESLGHYQSAIQNYTKVLEQLPAGENPADTLNDVGLLFCTLGRYEKALEYLYRALTLYLEMNSNKGIAQIEHSLGDVYFHMKEFNTSIQHFTKARLILSSENNSKALAYVHLGLGRSYTELGQFHEGINYLLSALDYSVQYDETYLKTQTSLALSGSYLTKKYYKQAHYYALKAKNLAEQSQNKRTRSFALRQLATISDRSGHYQQALSYYRSYLDNEIGLRNFEHSEAFQALELSKKQMEQNLLRSHLVDKNTYLTNENNQLQIQQLILFAALCMLAVVTFTLIRKNYILTRHVGIDCLTSALHRPAFIQKLSMKKTEKNNQCGLILLFDIDNLKSINNEHGYEMGNKVLKNISNTVERFLARDDYWGRLGGGKFAVVISRTENDEAQYTCESFCQTLTSLPVESNIQLSVSASYLCVGSLVNDFNELYPILDRALHHARGNGKDVIVNASQYTTKIDSFY